MNHSEIKKYATLYLINLGSKEEGVNLTEVYDQIKYSLKLNYGDLLSMVNSLEKEKLITSKYDGGTRICIIEEAGSKDLNSYLKGMQEVDFLRFLDFLPSEMALKYRISNIEYFFLHSSLSWLFSKTALYFIGEVRLILGLIFSFLSALFFGFALVSFSNTISFPVQKILSNIKITTKQNREIIVAIISLIGIIGIGIYSYFKFPDHFITTVLGFSLAWLVGIFRKNILTFFRKNFKP